VGIPERTGNDLANELDDDLEFAERRRRLHARALDRAESMVMRALGVLSERIENATELLGGDDPDAPLKVVDKSADYGRSIAALNDSLMKRRKIEHDMKPENKAAWPSGIRITIDGTEPSATDEQCPKS
jgi:hypothetical protein